MNRFKDKKFEKFSFDDLYLHFENDKKEKNADEALKLENKNKKFEEEKTFGYALVDNLV